MEPLIPHVETIEEIFKGRPSAARRAKPAIDDEARPVSPVAEVIPSTPSLDLPFSPLWSSHKICKACGENKPLTNEHWYRQKVWRNVSHDDGVDTWVQREKVWAPSTYCRSCTNQKQKGLQKLRRQLAKLPPEEAAAVRLQTQRGPCGVCGKKANERRLTLDSDPVGACPICHQLLNECEYSRRQARSTWWSLKTHVLDEERIRSEVAERTDRHRIPYHVFNPNWPKGLAYPHGSCMVMEKAWRAVVKYLDATQPPDLSEG